MNSNISEESIRQEIQANGAPQTPGRMNLANMRLTDQGKKAVNLALAEANSLEHNTVEPGHLLLGLLCEQDCFAAQMLLRRGANLSRIRETLKSPPTAA